MHIDNNKVFSLRRFIPMILIYTFLVSITSLFKINFNYKLVVMIFIVILSFMLVVEFKKLGMYITVITYLTGIIAIILTTKLSEIQYNCVIAFQISTIISILYLYAYIRKKDDLENQLYEYAIIDELSGIYNKRFYEYQVKQSINNAKRMGHKMAIIIFDIDCFKQINDTYGHHIGDILLKDIAHEINKEVRGSDTFCRYGGDEFIVTMSPYTKESGLALKKRISEALDRVNTSNAETISEPFTVSAGIAIYPDDGINKDTLFVVADACMYQSKTKEGTVITSNRELQKLGEIS